jgi:DMSO reductase family type II enzyme heme b subunit
MGNNPLRRLRGGTRTLLKELWPKLRKVITVDFRGSTSALYSDLVLPAAFFYEKEQFHSLTSNEVRFWAYGEKAIEPVGESRSEWRIANGLARTTAQRAHARGLDTYQVPHGVTPARCKAVPGRALSLPDTLRPLLGAQRHFHDIPQVLSMQGRYAEDDVEQALRDMVERCKAEGLFAADEGLEQIRQRCFVKYNGLGTSTQAQNIATDVQPDAVVTALLLHTRDHVPYPTLTGRAQFYIDHPWFLEAGEALPTHKDPPRQGGNYAFRMDSGHLRWSIHASDVWARAPVYGLKLSPVPVAAVETSPYVRRAFRYANTGAISCVHVQAVCDGKHLSIRMEWEDRTENAHSTGTTSLPDKAAVMFPLKPGASVMTMGSPAAPVNMWLWQADRQAPCDVLSRGIGTTTRRDAWLSGLSGSGVYAEGKWRVVLSRLLAGDGIEFVNLAGKRVLHVAFAVWEGSNRERGPLKAFSGEFQDLIVET